MRQPCSVAATMASMCRECRCEANRILNRVGLVTGEKAEIEIMAFFASPTGGGQVPELPLMREIQVLLRDIPASQQSVVPAPRWPLDVHSGLRKEAPRVLQFSGHTARGSLCFHSAAAEGLASLPDWRGWHDVLGRNKAERLEVPQNVAGATYHTMQQALAMGLREGDMSEIVKVIERAADFELPKTRD